MVIYLFKGPEVMVNFLLSSWDPRLNTGKSLTPLAVTSKYLVLSHKFYESKIRNLKNGNIYLYLINGLSSPSANLNVCVIGKK
jgi:hypothetical protein